MKVMEHMESLGGYSQFDFDKVRKGAKNPRKSLTVGRKHDNLLDEEESSKDTPKMRRKTGLPKRKRILRRPSQKMKKKRIRLKSRQSVVSAPDRAFKSNFRKFLRI